MKRVLVTGGAGFIGSNLCRKLLTSQEVIAVDNFITSTPDNVKQLLQNQHFTLIKHDITKPFSNSQRLLLSNLDEIYHLACPTGVPNVVTLAEEMLMTCSIGTRHILELAKQNNAKLIFTSTSEIYGDPEKFPQDETYTGNVDPLGMRSPYEEGKRFAESLIMLYVRKYGLDAKIVRIFNTYGPGMTFADQRIIPHFLQSVRSHKPIPVHGKGTQTRTFCYVDDLVQGLLLVQKKGKKGEVYNLGNDSEITIKKVAEMIKALTKTAVPIQFIERPDHDHNRRKPSLKKIKELGWQPKISFEDGLRSTIRWYGL
jgi:dTDP-glucose 4,6-dehydratase